MARRSLHTGRTTGTTNVSRQRCPGEHSSGVATGHTARVWCEDTLPGETCQHHTSTQQGDESLTHVVPGSATRVARYRWARSDVGGRWGGVDGDRDPSTRTV